MTILPFFSLLLAAAPPTAAADAHGDALPAGAVARLGAVRFRAPGYCLSVAVSPKGDLIASCGDRGVIVWDVQGRRVATFPLRATLPDDDKTTSVRFSPDGRRVVALVGRHSVYVCDLDIRRTIVLAGLTGRFSEVGFTADGKAVVAVDLEGRRIRTAQIATPGKSRDLVAPADLPKTLWSATCSADGSAVVVESFDAPGALVFDTATGKLRGKPMARTSHWGMSADGTLVADSGPFGHWSVVQAETGRAVVSGTYPYLDKWDFTRFPLKLSPDGRTILVGPRVHDARTGRRIGDLQGYHNTNETNSAALSHDGRTFAETTARSHAVRVWDVVTGTPSPWNDAHGHSAEVVGLAFSADGRTVATIGRDLTARIWDAATGTMRRVVTFDPDAGPMWSVAFAPDGRTFAVGLQETVEWIDTATGRVLRSFGTSVANSLAFSADGRFLTTGSEVGVERWDVTNGRRASGVAFDLDLGVRRVVVLPDGRFVESRRDGRVVLRDASGREVQQMRLRPPVGDGGEYYVSLCVSPDGLRVAGSCPGVGVRVWRVADGERLADIAADVAEHNTYDGYTDRSPLAFSPDGRCVAFCGNDGRARVYEVATRRETFTAEGPGMIAAFSPDGSTLAVTGAGTTATLWRLPSRRR